MPPITQTAKKKRNLIYLNQLDAVMSVIIQENIIFWKLP